MECQITDTVKGLVSEVLENEIKLAGIEYIKENNDYVLRISITGKTRKISIDDCVNVSKKLGKILDDKDVILNPYILDVFSACSNEEEA